MGRLAEILKKMEECDITDVFGTALERMKAYDGIETLSDHVFQPGMDTLKSPIKEVLERLKSVE